MRIVKAARRRATADALTNPALGLGSGLIKNARAGRYPQFHAHNSRGARPVKILVTPRSFGKNNPELFDILRDAGLEVIRNDTGGILSEEAVKEKLAAGHRQIRRGSGQY